MPRRSQGNLNELPSRLGMVGPLLVTVLFCTPLNSGCKKHVCGFGWQISSLRPTPVALWALDWRASGSQGRSGAARSLPGESSEGERGLHHFINALSPSTAPGLRQLCILRQYDPGQSICGARALRGRQSGVRAVTEQSCQELAVSGVALHLVTSGLSTQQVRKNQKPH